MRFARRTHCRVVEVGSVGHSTNAEVVTASHAPEMNVDLFVSCQRDVPKSRQSPAALLPTAGAHCENQLAFSFCGRH